MVFVRIPQIGFPAAIALAIGLELGGGYAQEQTAARPVGFAIRPDAAAGTYMFVPGQGRGPIYAILDGVAPATAAIGGDSAMIWDAPREGSRMEPGQPPLVQVVQAPSPQSVPQVAQPAAAVPLRMMRPAAPQAPVPIAAPIAEPQPALVRVVQRLAPIPEEAPVAPQPAPVQNTQQSAPVAPAPQHVAPVQAVQQSAPVAPARQAPVQVAQRSVEEAPAPQYVAPVSEQPALVQRPAPVPEEAPAQQYEAPVLAESVPVTQPAQQPAQIQPPTEVQSAPVREVPAQRPAPARAQRSGRQPARATPVSASAQQSASEERVSIAQAIPTGLPQNLYTSIVNRITGTGTNDITSPTNTATTDTAATTGTTTATTTSNGKTTTTSGKFTSTPSLIPGSAVSLTGQPDRWLIAMVLGFVGFEIFL